MLLGTGLALVAAFPVGCADAQRDVPPERAAGGRGEVRLERIASPGLANRIGDPTERDLLVYLPPGYERDAPRRYPVVHLLHSFGADPRTWLGGAGSYEGLDVAAVLDSLISAGDVAPMIVVMPDARTGLGGGWYADSPVSGRWEAFVGRDVVDFVDRRFRTIPERSARALAGQSMGAYGALRIAMTNPDTFGAALAMSPVLVRDPNPLGDAGARLALDADPAALREASVPARVLWSRAMAFSPDSAGRPPLAVLPWEAGAAAPVVREEVWRRWEESTLEHLARLHEPALRRLALRLEVGAADALRAEVELWSAALAAAGIDHELEVFRGGHVEGVRARFETSVFRFLSRVLDGARDRTAEDAARDRTGRGTPPVIDPAEDTARDRTGEARRSAG